MLLHPRSKNRLKNRSPRSLYITKEMITPSLKEITVSCFGVCCEWCHETWTLLCLCYFAQHLWNVTMSLLFEVTYLFPLMCSIFVTYHHTFVYFFLMNTCTVMSNTTLHILILVFRKHMLAIVYVNRIASWFSSRSSNNHCS